jgi:hypothetical protein
MELKLEPGSTVCDYIKAAVLPWASEDLLSADSIRQILATAAILPGDLTSFFGFECPLRERQGHADLLVCAQADGGGRMMLAGERTHWRQTPDLQAHPVWKRVFAFAELWNKPSSPLYEKVHNMWLEFDTGSEADVVPVPSVFFGARGLERPAEGQATLSLPNSHQWLTDMALPALREESLTDGEVTRIARCINALPKQAYVFQIGLMLSRRSRLTRLCVRGVPPDQIVDYLQDAGWKGSAGELGVVIDSLAEHVQSFSVDLDVDSDVSLKIGLECYPGPQVDQVRGLLDYLVSARLAVPEKAEAIARWRGLVHERLNRDAWPRDLLAASALLAGRMHSVFHRRLHHVKVVYEPGAALHAKAYLAVQHFWIEPRVFREALQDMQSKEPDLSIRLPVAKNGEACVPAY